MQVTTVHIGAPLLERVQDHALAGSPHEVCGILIGRNYEGTVRVSRMLPCHNIAPESERGRRFSIDPAAVINLQRALRPTAEAIVGFYHSHPHHSAVPSQLDLEHVRLWPETVWLIAGVNPRDETELRAWWLDAGHDDVRELAIVATQPVQPVCV